MKVGCKIVSIVESEFIAVGKLGVLVYPVSHVCQYSFHNFSLSMAHKSVVVGYSTDDNPPAVCGSENSYLSEITREDIERYTREQ